VIVIVIVIVSRHRIDQTRDLIIRQLQTLRLNVKKPSAVAGKVSFVLSHDRSDSEPHGSRDG